MSKEKKAHWHGSRTVGNSKYLYIKQYGGTWKIFSANGKKYIATVTGTINDAVAYTNELEKK